MKIAIIIGTRPEIIKMSPIIDEIIFSNNELLFIHTGQHYDTEMSDNIFKDLNLPTPNYNLHVGSGSHGHQTGLMMDKIEKIFLEEKPDIVLVQGDTNAVLAGALVSSKLHIPLGHVEAGLRSYDNFMPEEINRKVADICSNYYFVPSEKSALNLLKENISRKKIFITGNTVVDTCYRNLEIAKKKISNNDTEKDFLDLINLNNILLLTIHRAENVDNEQRLKSIIESILELKEFNIVFPIHPRTEKNLKKLDLYKKIYNQKHIHIIKPLSYLKFLILISKSKLILTDSGGLQEEAVTLHVPVLTLRYNTERPETVDIGANILVGTEKSKIVDYSLRILNDKQFSEKMKNVENPYGDGLSSKKIVEIILSKQEEGLLEIKSQQIIKKDPKIQICIIKEECTVLEYEENNNVSIKLISKNNEILYPYDNVNLKESIIYFEVNNK